MSKTNNLTDFLTDLANGIRTAEGTTAKIDPQDFRSRVEGVVATVLADDTVTADTLLSGVTAHDASGNAISGSIATQFGGFSETVEPQGPNDLGGMPFIRLQTEVSSPIHVSPSTGGAISLMAPIESFGDATSDAVAAGKTFTSSAGLKVVGTGEQIDSAYNRGYDVGYSDGCNETYDEAYEEGHNEGYNNCLLKNAPLICQGAYYPIISNEYGITNATMWSPQQFSSGECGVVYYINNNLACGVTSSSGVITITAINRNATYDVVVFLRIDFSYINMSDNQVSNRFYKYIDVASGSSNTAVIRVSDYQESEKVDYELEGVQYYV